MTSEEILTKAIQRAIDNGWKFNRVDMIDVPKELAEWAYNYHHPRYMQLIYQHDFAKALWGNMPPGYWNSMKIGEEKGELTIKHWQYHLQQMVIADKPIKYLGEHLDD